jgi:hypothetical protein
MCLMRVFCCLPVCQGASCVVENITIKKTQHIKSATAAATTAAVAACDRDCISPPPPPQTSDWRESRSRSRNFLYFYFRLAIGSELSGSSGVPKGPEGNIWVQWDPLCAGSGLVVPYSSHKREIAGSIPGWAH